MMNGINGEDPGQRLGRLNTHINQLLKHIDTRLAKQREELAESMRHVWYSQIADSLLALNTPVPRGTPSLTICNIHTQKIERVPLNPKLDIKGNIGLYYKKARKGKRGETACEYKVKESLSEKTALEELLLECDSLQNADVTIVREHLPALEGRFTVVTGKSITPAGHPDRESGVPFRHYTIDSWHVYIGRNEEQNDELSIHFAKPSDIWLHVAGHAGSHVVIRHPKNSPPPPREVIEKAAAMAVWFSKAKHTSFAEVHVTEARFVHKRRHAPPGEVVAERCKAVRIAPKSPHELFPSKYNIEKEE